MRLLPDSPVLKFLRPFDSLRQHVLTLYRDTYNIREGFESVSLENCVAPVFGIGNGHPQIREICPSEALTY